MGLDAVVYLQINNLLIDKADKKKVLVDEESGEACFEDPELSRKYAEKDFTATRVRLGNATNIASITGEIQSFIGGSPSILCDKVLYSASHCGDQIGVELLDKLESEIDFVQKQAIEGGSPFLEEFLRKMSELAKAAKEQGHPIVFT